MACPARQDTTRIQGQTDLIWKFTFPEKKFSTLCQIPATATRRRGATGLAVRDGRLYVAVNASYDWFDNATTAAEVDLEHCEPRYRKPAKTNQHDDPDCRSDFLRLLRLTGTPPGCKGLTWLETDRELALRQHIVIALTKEATIGTFVFPLPETKDLHLQISVLKPGAAYPPSSQNESDWIRIYKGTGKGWMAVAAPEKTVTRAIRLSFDKGLSDLDEIPLGDDHVDDLPGRPQEPPRPMSPGRPSWKA